MCQLVERGEILLPFRDQVPERRDIGLWFDHGRKAVKRASSVILPFVDGVRHTDVVLVAPRLAFNSTLGPKGNLVP
jgi:hypothetical protein